MLYISLIVSFCVGALISFLVAHAVYNKIISSTKEELVRYKTKLELSDDMQNVIKRDFIQLANDAIKNEQDILRKQNIDLIESKISPLALLLNDFKQRVDAFNIKGAENTVKIVEQIANLEKNNKSIEQEAKNLVEALTKNQNTKGSYGEDLLEQILQSCGMQDGIHYTKQYVTTAENISDERVHTVRPDIVINLPNNRNLIIDSKFTLTSYLSYIEDKARINEFKSAVKARITDLSKKNYHNAENTVQPDFVLMYMPIESSVNLLYEDTDIIKHAYNSNIIIVGTASLLTTIRLVNQLLAQQKQVESVSQIVLAGTNLYNTFVQFCEDLISLQKQFDSINSQFNKTINRFTRNNKNKPSLFSQVQALKEYGINSTKEIPVQLMCSEYDEDLEVLSKDNKDND